MAFNIDLKLSGKIVEGKAGPILDRKLDYALVKSLTFLESEVAKKVPVGVTGQARGGVDWKKDGKIRGRVYEKGPGLQYIEVLEKGRRLNQKMPPHDPIELWLRRTDKGKAFVIAIQKRYNIKTKEQALKQAVFLKRRAIGKRGTKALKMFETTYKQRKGWVVKQFRDAVREFTRT